MTGQRRRRRLSTSALKTSASFRLSDPYRTPGNWTRSWMMNRTASPLVLPTITIRGILEYVEIYVSGARFCCAREYHNGQLPSCTGCNGSRLAIPTHALTSELVGFNSQPGAAGPRLAEARSVHGAVQSLGHPL